MPRPASPLLSSSPHLTGLLALAGRVGPGQAALAERIGLGGGYRGNYANSQRAFAMLKFIGGTVGVIFLIGLLVVIGILALIF